MKQVKVTTTASQIRATRERMDWSRRLLGSKAGMTVREVRVMETGKPERKWEGDGWKRNWASAPVRLFKPVIVSGPDPAQSARILEWMQGWVHLEVMPVSRRSRAQARSIHWGPAPLMKVAKWIMGRDPGRPGDGRTVKSVVDGRKITGFLAVGFALRVVHGLPGSLTPLNPTAWLT